MNAPRMAVALATAVTLAAVPGIAQGIGQGITPARGQASTGVGTTGGLFLEIPVGAREAGMAGAAAASTSGLTAFYWNTAAAADIEQISALMARNDLYGKSGLKQSYFAIGIPAAGNVLGLSLSYFTSGDVIVTTESFPEGGDPSAGGVTRWDGFSAAVHGARRLTDRLSVGVTGKYVRDGINFAQAKWYAVDLSTLFRTGLLATTIGASLQNLGSNSRYQGTAIDENIPENRDVFPISREAEVSFRTAEVPLPTGMQFAVQTDVLGGANALFAGDGNHGMIVAAAMNESVGRPLQPSLGAEYRFRQVFFARVGKRFYNEAGGPWSGGSGFAGGFGLSFPVMERRFTFDWAMTHYDALPNTQSFTLQFGN